MNKYIKGSVIEFSNTLIGKLLVIDTCEVNEMQYLIVVPYKADIKDYNTQLNKLIMLEINQDENAIVVTDKELIANILNEVLKRDKNQ